MYQVKIASIRKEVFIKLALFSVLMGFVVIAPLFHQQAITGPLVNASLFISLVVLGLQGTVMIALVPSLVALSAGLLSPVMAPMIPFIMMGNIILILVFDLLRKRNYLLAVVAASLFKFLFLFFSSSAVINLLVKKEVAASVAAMMSWPQLFTALAGGAIALFVLKLIKKI